MCLNLAPQLCQLCCTRIAEILIHPPWSLVWRLVSGLTRPVILSLSTGMGGNIMSGVYLLFGQFFITLMSHSMCNLWPFIMQV